MEISEQKYLDIIDIMSNANPKFRAWARDRFGEGGNYEWQEETNRLLHDFLTERLEDLNHRMTADLLKIAV